MVAIVGADGLVDRLVVSQTYECCTHSLCDIDPCKLVCTFVDLLPTGPLWDKPKRQVLERFQEKCIDDVLIPPCLYVEELCSSIVVHSVYTALRLYDVLLNSAYPALQESDPLTAYVTLDDWLDKLGWINCFEGNCRDPDLGFLTPLEVTDGCGPIACSPDYPDDLVCAVKHAILVALTRLDIGVLSRVETINWVIEPLGARIQVTPNTEGLCPLQYDIIATGDTISECPRPACNYRPVAMIQAYFEPNLCYLTGLPDKIYPGVLAAECIVRSMLQRCDKIQINRKC